MTKANTVSILDLFSIQQRLMDNTPTRLVRFLYKHINWDNRLIAIIGSRGTGKTTFVLQHLIQQYKADIKNCFYFSADHPVAMRQGIYDTAREYFQKAGESVIIDEIHKQSNWSMEVKALYDAYPSKKIII